MSEFVLDCSVTATWLIADEASAETDQLLEQLRNSFGFVPAWWHLEVGNLLVQAEKKRRITSAQVADGVQLAGHLPVITDADHIRALHEVLNLARAENLTTYDAAYLELAMRRQLPLATLDQGLARAAGRHGVTVLPH